jgi:acetamidase/formamidase
MRLHPILDALDADGDGEISAAEIARASAALRTLDLSGDGMLTAPEVLPDPIKTQPIRDALVHALHHQ